MGNLTDNILKCIAIDDEHHALEMQCGLIRRHPRLALVEQFHGVESAIDFLSGRMDIDFVFSDIRLSGKSGLDVGPFLKANCRFLVYVTGYKQHALEAFEVGADAYLLKPLAYPKFSRKVNELIEKYDSQRKVHEEQLEWIYVTGDSRNQLVKVKLEDIISVKALGNYTSIETESGQIVVYRSLKEMEHVLEGRGFSRISKSMVVGLHHVEKIDNDTVCLSKGHERVVVSIGARFRHHFLDNVLKYRNVRFGG